MKCADCGEEILQKDPQKCPYCGSANLISSEDVVSNSIAEIEKLEKAGKYEAAALGYEKLEMWDMAKECRRIAETSPAISAKIKTGKVSAINIECPYCGASQPVSSKNNKVKCKKCGKKYIVPKKVLRIL